MIKRVIRINTSFCQPFNFKAVFLGFCILLVTSLYHRTAEYLGHVLTSNGIAKSPKVDAAIATSPHTDVASLRSFLGSVQFYSKFLPSNFSTFAEPLYRLIQFGVAWAWSKQEDDAFTKLKFMLSADAVLAHFDASVPIGIACDAPNVGIGATLFHRYPDENETLMAIVTKTLSKSQRNYSQIQKEALAIVFALEKFYQFLFGRKFILVMDHKPLIAILGPHKEIPSLAVHRLTRWALFLSQFEYDIEYRMRKDHTNADAFSRLPSGGSVKFDKKEKEQVVEIVCTIELLGRQVTASDSQTLRKETAKDHALSQGFDLFVKVGQFVLLMTWSKIFENFHLL